MRRSLPLVLATLLVACASGAAVSARVAPVVPANVEDELPGLTIGRDAIDTLLRGLDTATVEKGFCVMSHMDTTVHYAAPLRLTEPQLHIVYARTADSLSVQTDSTVDFSCPGNEVTVHWHLDDRGFYDFPSPPDKRSLRATLPFRKAAGNPYDVIVARDSSRAYHFVLFSVDTFARR